MKTIKIKVIVKLILWCYTAKIYIILLIIKTYQEGRQSGSFG